MLKVKLLMAAAKAGADRQELHERLRELSMQAWSAVEKDERNPLADLIKGDPLVARHLRTAFREPGNRGAREAMSLAACQGGMAFANSSVCLVHGMSRPIGPSRRSASTLSVRV